jgi:hypothetical protein
VVIRPPVAKNGAAFLPVLLPNAQGPPLGFLMCPQAETAGQRLDAYAPEDFCCRISAKEIAA